MKPVFVCSTQSCTWLVALLLLFVQRPVHTQQIIEAIDDPHSLADYVIIAPPSYTTIMHDFAVHRSTYGGLRVVIVTTDAIYQVFGQGVRPDSAIRAFITYALTSWSNPKPQYFLLAGNVNTIPPHREVSMIPQFEDSVMVDQWFVEGVPDSAGRPAAVIGRMPGWDVPHMTILLWKTMQYDLSSATGWRNRVMTVADYSPEVGSLFEQSARSLQIRFAQRWTDTVTAHVRPTSPLHKTRTQFRTLWNNGAAIVTFVGLSSGTAFSESAYFTTADVDSLADGSPLPMVRLHGRQRFENRDTLSLTMALLLNPWKGAVCALSPTGLSYFSTGQMFNERLAQILAANPTRSIGSIVLDVKRQVSGVGQELRLETLLGDPALVIKNPVLAGGGNGGGDVPRAFALHQNFPNPFNPETKIRFQIADFGFVSLKVFDVLGEEMATLVNEVKPAGTYDVVYDASRLSSGVYFYRLEMNGHVQTRKLVLLR